MVKKLLVFICVLCLGLLPVFSTHTAPPVMVEATAVEQVVYITKTGKRYHKSSCHHLKRSKIKTTKSQAQKLGYTPCTVCKP